MKIALILEVSISFEHENKRWIFPLNKNATCDPYWNVVGIFKPDIVSTPNSLINNDSYPRVKLQRTGKTIVDKFAGFLPSPLYIELLVQMEDTSRSRITILRKPRGGLSSKEAYMVNIFDPKKKCT